MKRITSKVLGYLGNVAVCVAVFSVYVGHPHCLLVIHQPVVPEELKRIENM